MKIDLHIHTIETFKGDGVNRNINPKKFKEKMNEENIGICAITNHNLFNIDQFNKFKPNKEEFILLPGIELDVFINDINSRRQLNIIFPPNKSKEFKECCNKIENKISSLNPMKLSEIIEIFDNHDTIFMPDHKRHINKNKHGLWWEQSEIKYLEEETKGFVIADSNNPETLMVLMSSNFKALIGSDVQDWDKYSDDAKRLVSTNIKIENFDNFLSILKYDKKALKKLIEKNEGKIIKNIIIEDDNNNKYRVGDIKIYQGVNIIFGPRATGKSKVLKYMYDYDRSRSILYKSSEIKDMFSDLSKDENQVEFQKDKNDFENLIKLIRDYKEEIFSDFHKIYKSLIKSSSIKFHVTKKQVSNPSINPENGLIKILKIKDSISISIDEMSNYKEKILSKENYLCASKMVLSELWKKNINIKKEYMFFLFKNKIYKEINNIISNHQGKVEAPNHIGLLKRYESKAIFINSMLQIIKFEKKKSIIKSELVSLKRGTISVVKTINFLEVGFADKTAELVVAKKNKDITNINNLNKILNKTGGFSFEDNFEEIRKSEIFDEKKTLFYVTSKIQDERGNGDFSDGEKAHITLNNILSNFENKDYYFLDEPDVFLGQTIISDFLFPKITELVEKGKTVVISTHNGALGVNTIPNQYIYRESSLNDNYLTYKGSIWSNSFAIDDSLEVINFKETIINNFEGGKQHFNFRKGIYEEN